MQNTTVNSIPLSSPWGTATK
uniref:Uncharacterized protein n=1 Tax=Arundo donax TaxID=35708 RepID=A0A0A9A8M0_ARUDO